MQNSGQNSNQSHFVSSRLSQTRTSPRSRAVTISLLSAIFFLLVSLPTLSAHEIGKTNPQVDLQYTKLVVQGKVTNSSDGAPLPGVYVIIKGTNQGTVTDVEGKFKIAIPSGSSEVLVFSFIGYATQEIEVKGNEEEIKVKMEMDVKSLGTP
ncbi:MAG: carboxypeptidase-like regulatory domain-containing protein [Bacteroidota bacterium]